MFSISLGRAKAVILILLAACFLFGLYYTFFEISVNIQEEKTVWNRRTTRVRVDSSFSPAEIATISRALAKWSSATGGEIVFEAEIAEIHSGEIFSWEQDSVPTIYNATSFVNWPYHIAQVSGNFNVALGFTLVETADIFILNTGRLLESTIMHEAGHVIIGAYHSKNEKDLMYPMIADPKGISVDDATMAIIIVGKWDKKQ